MWLKVSSSWLQWCQAVLCVVTVLAIFLLFHAFDVQQPARNSVIVFGIPRVTNREKVAKTLDMMADNCGGRLISLDFNSGTASISYRSYESAQKWV